MVQSDNATEPELDLREQGRERHLGRGEPGLHPDRQRLTIIGEILQLLSISLGVNDEL